MLLQVFSWPLVSIVIFRCVAQVLRVCQELHFVRCTATFLYLVHSAFIIITSLLDFSPLSVFLRSALLVFTRHVAAYNDNVLRN